MDDPLLPNGFIDRVWVQVSAHRLLSRARKSSGTLSFDIVATQKHP